MPALVNLIKLLKMFGFYVTTRLLLEHKSDRRRWGI